ncbi:hypothetical protein ACFL6H_02520 [Candidatus Latescibacterota bacterium]
MKKLIILLLCIMFATVIVTGCSNVLHRSTLPDISGTWNGEVESETGDIQRGVMEITKNADGTLAGMLIATDGGMPNTPIDVITLKGSKIHFEIPSMNGVFDGVVTDKGTTISGEWLINDIKFKVVMKKEQ